MTTPPDVANLVAALEEVEALLSASSARKYANVESALRTTTEALFAYRASDRPLCARTLEKAAEVAENPTGVWWHGYDSLNDAIAAEIRALAKEG